MKKENFGQTKILLNLWIGKNQKSILFPILNLQAIDNAIDKTDWSNFNTYSNNGVFIAQKNEN